MTISNSTGGFFPEYWQPQYPTYYPTTTTTLSYNFTPKKKIYIGGTFDLFHPGHVELFRKAKAIADYVVISVNRDEFVERYKNKKPVYSLKERMDMVASCKYVDEVVINIGDEDSKPAILKVKPNFILHSAEWNGEVLMSQMGLTKEFLDKNNITMVYVDRTPDVSSTELRERIKKHGKS